MSDLRKENRAPKVIVLENVYGAITSNGGRDLGSISKALADIGYNFGAVVIDAKDYAYHLAGDGVVVPAVEFLRLHLLNHILDHAKQSWSPLSRSRVPDASA